MIVFYENSCFESQKSVKKIKLNFQATAVISLHLCDPGSQEKAGGESKMLQNPDKKVDSERSRSPPSAHCAACGEIILHEFTHNQSPHGSDAALVVQYFAMAGYWVLQWVGVG